MKKILLPILILVSFFGSAQTHYNPSQQPGFTFPINKPIGPNGNFNIEARSLKMDTVNFLYRLYNGTGEILSYLNLAQFRRGYFPIYANVGGALQSNGTFIGGQTEVFWFKNGVADSNLVRWYTDSIPPGLGSVTNVAATNALGYTWTITNPTTTPNISLSLTGGGDLSGTWPSITVNSIQGHDLSYIQNYNNLSNTPAPLTLTTTGTSGVATYNSGTGVLNIPNYSGSGGGLCLNCNADTIGHIPLNFVSFCNGCVLTLDSVAGTASWQPPTGSGGPIPPNIGTGYRIYSPQVPGLRSLICASGCTLDSTTNSNSLTLTITSGGAGTVTSFSAGNLSGLFTTAVSTATTTPALTFTGATFPAYNIYGNNTASPAGAIQFAPTFSILNQWAGGTIALLGNIQTFSALNTFSGGLKLSSNVSYSADNTYGIGDGTNGANDVWARFFESNSLLSLVSGASSGITFFTNGGGGAKMLLASGGQLQLTTYTGSVTGTPTTVAEFDAAGNLIQGAISGFTNSVTNSDGTLTISPTSGNVIASLNLAHANMWSALQTFGALTATGTVTLSGLLSGGATDSVVTWNPSTHVLGVTTKSFQLFAVQGVSSFYSGGNTNVDTIILGGSKSPFFMPDTIVTQGQSFLITGLPSKASSVSTDSVLVEDVNKKLWLLPVPSGGGGGSQTLQQVFTQQNPAILTVSDTIDAATNSVPLVLKGNLFSSANAIYTLGGANNFLSVNSHQFLSNNNWVAGVGSAFSYTFNINSLPVFNIASTGQQNWAPYIGNVFAGTLTGGNPDSVVTINNGAVRKVPAASFGLGTVTTFSAGNLSPLFTTSVTNPTTTPSLSFTLSTAAANTAFGNFTGSTAAPGFGKVSLAAQATNTANTLMGYDGSGNPSDITAGSGVTIAAGVISASGGGTPALSPGHIFVGNVSSAATDTAFVNDQQNMQQVNLWYSGQGDTAISFITNYKWNTLDSVPLPYSTVGATNDFGGWLTTTTIGNDSLQDNTPIGVVFGASLAAGHPWRNSPLETPGLHDTVGQISWHLTQGTNYQWKNMGIGGQGTVQARPRFMRDCLGQIATVNDTRGNKTLTHPPIAVVIVGGLILNDIYNNVPVTTIENNYLWMAEQCMENHVYCIMTNCIGESGSTQAQLLAISQFNTWMSSGVLDQFNVFVFDINALWNFGTYFPPAGAQRTNLVYSSLVNAGDGVHFTQAGYDSVAVNILRYAKPPVLTKMAIVTQLAASNPITNYGRPTTFTVSGYPTGTIPGFPTTYTVPNAAFDTIAVTSPIPDTAWFRPTAKTTVAGAGTQYGWSTINFYLTNNPTGQIWYTQKGPFAGATTGNQTATSLMLRSDRYQNGITLLDLQNSDQSDIFKVLSQTVGNTQITVNDLTSAGPLNSAIVTIRASGLNAIGSNGSAIFTGTNNQLGQLQIGQTTAPGTTGFGIGIVSGSLDIEGGSSGAISADVIKLNKWNTNIPTFAGSNTVLGIIRTSGGFGAISGSTDTVATIVATPTFNQSSSAGSPSLMGMLYLNPTVTATGNSIPFGIYSDKLNNYFNPTAGNVDIGARNDLASSQFTVFSTTKGTVPHPTMTTAQMNAISSPATGLHVWNSDINADMVYNGTVWKLPASINLFSQTAAGTAVTGTSAATLLGTGAGSLTIPANLLTVGTTIVIHGWGALSTTTGSQTLTVNFLNSTASTGSGFSVTGSLSGAFVEIQIDATIITTGSGGTMAVEGKVLVNGVQANPINLTNLAINTTVSQTFDVQALWGGSGNSINTVPIVTLKLQ